MNNKNAEALLIAAFFEEYQHAPIRKITVASVIKRADVNRATFYYHFCDIYDLRDKAQSRLISEIVAFAENSDISQFDAVGEQILEKYGKRISVLLADGDAGFSAKLTAAMKPAVKKFLKIDPEDKKTKQMMSFVMGGMTGYITQLYTSSEIVDTKEAVKVMQGFMSACIKAAF